MQGLLQPNLEEPDLWGMKKIKGTVVNSYYQDVGSVIYLKLVMPLEKKKNILQYSVLADRMEFLLLECSILFVHWTP